MDASVNIAENIVNLRYEDIPSEVIEITKRQVLDTLGVIAAASTMGDSSREIVKLIKESGAKGASTIIGHGGRVPSWMAGFANGAMVHELDYDDTTGGHPGSCTVPAAFAVAEETGGIDGKEFMTAVAVAVDLKFRMNAAIPGTEEGLGTSGWMVPPLLGYFTAAAAAGRLLGLDENGMLDAFGHTLQQAAGSIQWQYSPGDVFRGVRDGFANKAGIFSALMAKRGLPGTRDSLEGKAGLYNLYFKGEYDRSLLVDGLGRKFNNTKVGFKPWPSCLASHSSIDAALEILNSSDIQPGDIEEIVVLAPEAFEAGKAQAETLEQRRRPRTVTDAKFSLPFTLGVAAIKKRVAIKDFTPDGIKDPAVLEMAGKVSIKVTDELEGTSSNHPMVEIKTRDGKRYSKRVDIIYGNSQKPLAEKDLMEKFRDCVSFSAKPLSNTDVEGIIDMVGNLENIDDVSRVIRLLG